MAGKIRVLVVDDSAFARMVLSKMLAADPEIEVVGTAGDPYFARDKILELKPDLITLDVEMPRMDGLSFLRILMRERPMPVVMVSSLTERGADATMRALELGAVDFITKPKIDISQGLAPLVPEIIEKIKAAARARVVSPRTPAPADDGERRAVKMRSPLSRTTQRLLAIGASTGGTEALREFLVALPPDAPGGLIVQHMPEGFTASFARRCDQLSSVHVKEAEDGDRVLQGHVLIAPGNRQMRLARDGAAYLVRITDEPPVNRHRPSVDVLFHSVAEWAGSNAVGVILTGMGDDGARGMLAMRRAGARTIAQDRETCVVFGMPREAIAAGGVDEVLPLLEIAPRALQMAADNAAVHAA